MGWHITNTFVYWKKIEKTNICIIRYCIDLQLIFFIYKVFIHYQISALYDHLIEMQCVAGKNIYFVPVCDIKI